MTANLHVVRSETDDPRTVLRRMVREELFGPLKEALRGSIGPNPDYFRELAFDETISDEERGRTLREMFWPRDA